VSSFAQRVQLGPFFSTGVINGAAKLEHYAAGTSTLKNIWSDRAMGTTLAQPFVADADGIFNFFADGLYKLVLTDAAGTVLYTLDNWQFIDRTDPTFGEGAMISSASTIAVGPEVFTHIGGSTDISVITGSIPFVWTVFDGNLSLIHSASLLMPDARNRTMLAGDVAFFLNEGAGVWRLAAHMQAGGAYLGRQGADTSASATLPVPTDGDFVNVSGSTTITAIAPAAAGYRFRARFTGTGLNLLYNATSMLCPFETDYRTSLNEIIEFLSLGSGNWLVIPLTGAPSLQPGTPFPWWGTTAPKGGVLMDGTAINCTTYTGLAKVLVLSAALLGNTGTSVGGFTANPGTDEMTTTGHGFAANDLVHITNAGGAPPGGLAINTVYYIKTVVNSNVYTLSATRGGALLDLTTAGTGTHTIHNKVNAPDQRGRFWTALDNLGGSSANRVTDAAADSLGGSGGTEIIATSQMPAHTHVQNVAASSGGSPAYPATSGFTATVTNANATDSTGGGLAYHQPFLAGGMAIRF
jgi:hypothetical protein